MADINIQWKYKNNQLRTQKVVVGEIDFKQDPEIYDKRHIVCSLKAGTIINNMVVMLENTGELPTGVEIKPTVLISSDTYREKHNNDYAAFKSDAIDPLKGAEPLFLDTTGGGGTGGTGNNNSCDLSDLAQGLEPYFSGSANTGNIMPFTVQDDLNVGIQLDPNTLPDDRLKRGKLKVVLSFIETDDVNGDRVYEVK